jgi:hypothetical protein
MKDLPKILSQQKWLDKRLSRKEDSKEDIALKKSLFLVLAPSIAIVLITSTILYLLKLPNISMAMFIYSMFELLLLLILIIVPRYISVLALINQYFVVLFSLVCVLYFGGILNSAGAILLGLASVINSVSFLKPKQTKILLIFYLFTILLEVVLDPLLRPLPEITPRVNLILFALHLLVIAYSLITTLSFYFEQN